MDFEQAFDILPTQGWLSKDEAQLLWDWAKGTDGPILEVGCYHGRATCLLAQLGRPLLCVDPFVGFDEDDMDGQKTIAAFYRNLASRGFSTLTVPLTTGLVEWPKEFPTEVPRVALFLQKIEEWLPERYGPINFCYLDGDHTYEGTTAQVRVAIRAGAKRIAVHDVNDHGDGVQVREACLRILGPWVKRVGRLAVWEVKV